MTVPPAIIQFDEPVEIAVKKFEETGAWNLPVIKNDAYFGFISKSKLFSAYRQKLVEFSEE